MLQLSLIEFIFRAIPEALILSFGVYTFAHIPVSKRIIIKTSLILAIIIFGVRSLPISYGIHTLLGLTAIMVIVRVLHKVDFVKAIQGVIITVIIQFIVELINTFWIQVVLSKDLEMIFTNPYKKLAYGMPSLLIWGVIIWIFYKKRVYNHED